MNGTPDRDEKFQIICDKFDAKLPVRILAIETSWARAAAGGDVEAVQSLHLALHSLAGSAGTFDRPELGAIAKALERRIEESLNGVTLPLGTLEPLLPLLDELRQAARIPARAASEANAAGPNGPHEIDKPA
ncbi:MAG: Hpt domain-containing protein [Aeromicrobium sp.]|nr:Hpt domain-containing protein [Burkholderiales bacterium]